MTYRKQIIFIGEGTSQGPGLMPAMQERHDKVTWQPGSWSCPTMQRMTFFVKNTLISKSPRPTSVKWDLLICSPHTGIRKGIACVSTAQHRSQTWNPQQVCCFPLTARHLYQGPVRGVQVDSVQKARQESTRKPAWIESVTSAIPPQFKTSCSHCFRWMSVIFYK